MAIQKFTVSGRAHLQDDETGVDVPPGQVVGLDDEIEHRDIKALLQAGHIKPVEDPKVAKKPEKQE